MTWMPILSFAVIAAVLGIGDLVASKTKGIISSVIVAILIFLVFGGCLHLLPHNLMEQSGLVSLIPTFGMGLILVNVGSLLDLNELRTEWKTVLVSLGGVIGIVIVDFTLGIVFFGREQALCAAVPTAGGMAATMLLTEAANHAQRADLASFAAAVMAFQILIGLPISSVCLRKEALGFLAAGGHKIECEKGRRRINYRILPKPPKIMDVPSFHLARLAIVGALAQLCSRVTGISTGVTFLLFGAVFGAVGFLEKGSLRTAGGEGLLMLATYASITASFVGMNLVQFGRMLIPVGGLLLLGAVGVIAVSSLMGYLLKWGPWLSIAVGLSCMFGYPSTYAVATEVAAGVTRGQDFTPEEEKRILDHLLSKMLIAGMVSVSLASVILAGIIIPILF